MTLFRYDGVHYISERIGLCFCMGTMMTMVRDYVHDERDSDMLMMRLMMQFFTVPKMERYACMHS